MVRGRKWPSVSLLRGARGRRAAGDLDAADLLQGAAVEREALHVFLDHVAHEDRLAVGREGRALRPVADRRLGDLRQLRALRAQHPEPAAVAVERRLLRLVAAVHHHDRDVPAVGRDLDALRRLTDADRLDHARRLRADVDEADRVGVALADADVGDGREVALRRHVGAGRPEAGADVALWEFRLGCAGRAPGDPVIAGWLDPGHRRG